jgi:hypothetical protein
VFTVAGQTIGASSYLTHGVATARTVDAQCQFTVQQDMNCLVSASVSVANKLLAGSQFSVRDLGPSL